MKKLLLIFLLLPLSPRASDLYSTFDAVYKGARRSLGIDTTTNVGLTDQAGADFVREGLLALQPLLQGDETEWIFTTTYNTFRYSIDSSIIGITSVFIQKGDTVKVLLPVTIEEWDKATHKSTLGQDGLLGFPSYYDWTNSYLYLFPCPTHKSGDYDTVRVMGYTSVSDLDTITTLSHLPERFRVAIKKYVTWRAAGANFDVRTPLFKKELDEQIAILRGEKANAKAAE